MSGSSIRSVAFNCKLVPPADCTANSLAPGTMALAGPVESTDSMRKPSGSDWRAGGEPVVCAISGKGASATNVMPSQGCAVANQIAVAQTMRTQSNVVHMKYGPTGSMPVESAMDSVAGAVAEFVIAHLQ